MTKKGLFKCIIFAMFICMAVSCRVEAAGDDGNKPPVPVTPVYDWYETPIDVETGNAPDNSTKFVFFGVFPRSVVKQEGTTLYGKDKVTEITIDESEENSITRGAYTYYKGSDNEYYYKMAENAYADYTKYSDGSDVNKLSANSERWFLVEPIKWRRKRFKNE